MNDDFLISESMLDDFESTWRRRRRLAVESVGYFGWMTAILSLVFLASAVGSLIAGNEVGGMTVLACLPIPALALGVVLLVVRRDARKADDVLRMIADIRRRNKTTGGSR